MLKVCINCGKEFEAKFDRAKYCCNNCKSSYRRKINSIKKLCVQCGTEFLSIGGKSIFCSRSCQAKYLHENLTPKILICDLCGEEFEFIGSTVAKYCKECRKLRNRELRILSGVRLGHIQNGFVGKGRNCKKGEEHHSYKDGIGIYKTLKYTYMIENNIPIKCELCDSEHNLEVHHIDENRHNNDLSNLILLCKSCHKKQHIHRDDKGRFMSSE